MVTAAPDPTLSACIEWLFASRAPRFDDRIRRAARAGFTAVEFWGWRKKDLGAIETALHETGLALSSIVVEPMLWLTDPDQHEAWLQGLAESIEAARRLGAPLMIAQAGNLRANISRTEQHEAIVEVLKRGADVLEGSGVTLTLEPLNDRVDHPGYYLTSTAEGLDIIDAVNRPEVRLLYDIYHSAVMGEDTPSVVGDRIDRIAHVHLADHPGRNEPGSGAMDWQDRLSWLKSRGYKGYVGLEYKPSGPEAPYA